LRSWHLADLDSSPRSEPVNAIATSVRLLVALQNSAGVF